MSTVSTLRDLRRKPVEAPKNPLDKTTIVSIFPKVISEYKPTIIPGRFEIPAGTFEKPSTLVVGASSWWREIDEDQPLLEIPQHSVQVADSIVKDYVIGVLGYSPEVASPGLFYIVGNFTVPQIQKEYRGALEKAKALQDAWYLALIKLADSLWSRSNGNPLAISDDMRLAARMMGQTVKDWMKDHRMGEMVRCTACGSLKNPDYPVCMTCRAIDPSHPKAKDLKFAE